MIEQITVEAIDGSIRDTPPNGGEAQPSTQAGSLSTRIGPVTVVAMAVEGTLIPTPVYRRDRLPAGIRLDARP